MENATRMERNRTHKLRITEIPPNREIKRIECPYCDTLLQVGLGENGKCKDITTVCKRCKRVLLISDEYDE